MMELAFEAIRLWRGEPDSLRQVNVSSNHAFSFFASGQPLFLRLTSSRDRTLEQIEAEFDFINYLHRNRVTVCLPLPSTNRRAVETICYGDEIQFACVFEEAEGECFTFSSDDANLQHFRLRGRTLGQIHSFARDYSPAEGSLRFGWEQDDLFSNIGRYLPQSEDVVWAEYAQLIKWLSAHPQDRDTFGLIHGDFGPTNFRCRNGALTVFDFDDCCYHWYAYDLAITIYPHGWRKGAKRLMEALIDGYLEEFEGVANLSDEVVEFCRLRQLYMFLNYAKRWGLTDIPEERASWFARKRDNIACGYILVE
jgi:Ser/Thr protein kinase RdoA (MazF antagonist)